MSQDQTQTETGGESKIKGIDDAWSKADKALEQMSIAEKAQDEKPREEKPCDAPDCVKAREAKEAAAKETRKPFKVLRVQGKDYPVYSEAEYDAMAQKGIDYTKKTSAVADERRQLAEERKKAEEEISAKSNEIAKTTERLEAILERLDGKRGDGSGKTETGGQPREEAKPVVTLDTVYAEYEIDPKFAEPWQKRMVENDFKNRKENDELRAAVKEADNNARVLLMKDALGEMGRLIQEARKEFPFEEVMNEKTKENITQKEFIANLKTKVQIAIDSGQAAKTKLPDLIKETVREISETQHRIAEGSKPPVNDDSPDDEVMAYLAKIFPKKFQAIKAKVADNAVAENEEEKSIIPPSLNGRKSDADEAKKPGQRGKPKGIDGFIDAASQDPDLAEIFSH